MQRNNYIIAILFALLLGSGIVYYMLNFRYNSAVYSLMRISHAISDSRPDVLSELCNMPNLSASFEAYLPVLEHNAVFAADSNTLSQLKYFSETGADDEFFLAFFAFLSQIKADMVFQKEYAHSKRRYVSQHYKIRGTDYSIVLRLLFLNKNGFFILEAIDNVILVKV